ncbi:MAG: GAF domain-containing protein, partial [Ilumatobacteraceae bacterium]
MVVGSQLSLSAVLLRIIETGTELVGARYGALGVLDPSGTQLTDFVTVGIDDEQARLIGAQPQGHGILGLLVVTPVPLRMPDLNAHPDSGGFPPNHPPMVSFLGVPILLRDAVFGNLYFANKSNDQPFNDVDEQLAVALAAAAALAIENTRLNERKHAMKLLEERERIARDLHDDVIQRVFAAGLALHVTAQMSTEPAIAARLVQIGSDLDVTIREVRNTIFRLNDQRGPHSLRAEIAAICTDSTPALGFGPSCHTRGPIDESVSMTLARDVVAVVREALSNVVRHARATKVDVLVVVDSRHLVIEVTDDGVGLATGNRDT